MKIVTKLDLTTIKTYATIREETEKLEGFVPPVVVEEIEKVLRKSFYDFSNMKIVKKAIASYDAFCDYIEEKTPDYAMAELDASICGKYRFYSIGQNKDGNKISRPFDSSFWNYMAVNRPFTVMFCEGSVVTVVHVPTKSIKLTDREYEIYKELSADW